MTKPDSTAVVSTVPIHERVQTFCRTDTHVRVWMLLCFIWIIGTTFLVIGTVSVINNQKDGYKVISKIDIKNKKEMKDFQKSRNDTKAVSKRGFYWVVAAITLHLGIIVYLIARLLKDLYIRFQLKRRQMRIQSNEDPLPTYDDCIAQETPPPVYKDIKPMSIEWWSSLFSIRGDNGDTSPPPPYSLSDLMSKSLTSIYNRTKLFKQGKISKRESQSSLPPNVDKMEQGIGLVRKTNSNPNLMISQTNSNYKTKSYLNKPINFEITQSTPMINCISHEKSINTSLKSLPVYEEESESSIEMNIQSRVKIYTNDEDDKSESDVLLSSRSDHSIDINSYNENKYQTLPLRKKVKQTRKKSMIHHYSDRKDLYDTNIRNSAAPPKVYFSKVSYVVLPVIEENDVESKLI